MKTIQKFRHYCMILLVVLASTAYGQEPTRNYEFDGQVKWMLFTDTETLLASTGEALVGIKPNTSELAFKIDRLKKVKEENLEFVIY